MQLLIFFNRNEEGVIDFIDKIKVNNEKTLVKFGTINNEQLSLTFYIHGELDASIAKFEDKIRCLFNCSNVEDLNKINSLLASIENEYSFEFSPFLKISKGEEPTLHAFHLIIDFGNNEALNEGFDIES
jgi:hypothetical protein